MPTNTEEAPSEAIVAEHRRRNASMTELLHAGASWSGRERNCAYLNLAGGQFANLSAVSGFDYLDDSRGIGVVDWDGDGDLDYWMSNRTSPMVRFLRNNLHDGQHTDGGHFLAVRLTDTVGNRDAIGARVEVVLAESRVQNSASRVEEETFTPASDPRPSTLDPRPLVRIKTVRAGGAFLSQSSKWLHFGLGAEGEIDRLEIRWPDGTVEQVPGLKRDGRYHVVRGKGVVARMPDRDVQIEAETIEPKPPASAERIVLGKRVPMPPLRYSDYDGRDLGLTVAPQRPRLILLWASWCATCAGELTSLCDNEQRLRRSGIDIHLLSVNGLNGDTTDPQDAVRHLKRIAFPFAAGQAPRSVLEKLRIMREYVITTATGTAVPAAYLVDRDDWLAAIYQGKLDLDQLLDDVEHLGDDPVASRERASAMAGRWFSLPRILNFDVLATKVQSQNEQDALVILRKELAMRVRWPQLSIRPREAKLRETLSPDAE